MIVIGILPSGFIFMEALITWISKIICLGRTIKIRLEEAQGIFNNTIIKKADFYR